MTEYKSLDYLREIASNNIMTKDDVMDMLQNISYILSDNGYYDARFFIDDIIDSIDNDEIDI